MGENTQAFTPLVWGVKSSLVSYVRGLGDGEIVVVAPAALAALDPTAGPAVAERFVFAPDPDGSHFDHDTQSGQLRFRGTVIFSGHFNAMRLELCDPRLDLHGGTGTLSVRTNGRIGTPRWDAIATAAILPGPDSAPDISVGLALTAAGRMLLGQQYQVGQALEPAFVEKVQRVTSAATQHHHPKGDNNEQ